MLTTRNDLYCYRVFGHRRTKEDVEFELGEKSRETILLDAKKIWERNTEDMKATIENCTQYTNDYHRLKGAQRDEVLLRLYSETAKLKAAAVWFVVILFNWNWGHASVHTTGCSSEWMFVCMCELT